MESSIRPLSDRLGYDGFSHQFVTEYRNFFQQKTSKVSEQIVLLNIPLKHALNKLNTSKRNTINNSGEVKLKTIENLQFDVSNSGELDFYYLTRRIKLIIKERLRCVEF